MLLPRGPLSTPRGKHENTMLESLAEASTHGFPNSKDITVKAKVFVKSEGIIQKWSVQEIDKDDVVLQLEDQEKTVSKGWFVYDTTSQGFVQQQLDLFGEIEGGKTTSTVQVWRDILNPEVMMNCEVLRILLNWTTYCFSRNDELDLPAAQSKTWLADVALWQFCVQQNDPKRLPPAKRSK